MASTGNTFPGTGESVARSTATAWTSPGNVVSDNGTDATCNSGASGSAYLVARNYGFAIPSDATIVGVTVRAEASEHSAGTETLNAQLQDGSAALVGSSKTANISGTGKTVYTYGGAADVWGATLTPAVVNDADFGVRLWFTTTHDVRIDFVTLAVEYTTETNEALTGSAVTMAAGTLIPTPSSALFGQVLTASAGDVIAPVSRGQEIASALQSLAETFVTVALVGSQILSAQGPISPNLDGNVPLVGHESVVSAGTVGPDYTRALAGEEVTVSAGDVTYVLVPVFTGQEIASASGTVVGSGDGVTVHISGVEAEFALGSIVSGGTTLSGAAVTCSAGTQAPSNTVALTGESMTAGQGFVTPGIDADDTYIASSSGSPTLTVEVALEGDQVDCSTGSLNTGDAQQALSGSEATSAAGTATANLDVGLIGSQFSGELGNFGAPGFASLTGSAVTVTAGDVFTTDDRTYAITGEAITVGQGLAVTSYLAFATGEQMSLSIQDIGPRGVALTGEQIAVGQGDVEPPRKATLPGKRKGPKDRRMTVVVDDREYEVDSVQEAYDLVDSVKREAEQKAAAELAKSAEKPVNKRIVRVVKHKLKEPTIEVQGEGDEIAALREEVSKALAQIQQTYADTIKAITDRKPDDDEEAIRILLS